MVSSSKKKKNSIKEEIILLLILGLSVLLFLGNFGWAGLGDTGFNWLSKRFRGAVGAVEYILPVCMIISSLFCYFNKGNKKLYVKIGLACFAILLVAVMIALLHGSDDMELTLSGYFNEGMEHIFSGGAMGGMLASFLYQKFGMTASFFIVFLLFIIDGVILSEKSLIAQLQQQIGKSGAQPHRRTGPQGNKKEKRTPVSQKNESRRRARADENSVKKPVQRKQKRKPANGMSLLTLKDTKKNRPFNARALVDEVHEVFSEGDFYEYPSEDEQNIVTQQTEDAYSKAAFADGEAEGTFAKEERAGNREQEKNKKPSDKENVYEKPPLKLLNKGKKNVKEAQDVLKKTGMKLQQTLQSFGVNVSMTNISCGPSVTRYELQPEQGVKVSKIVNLADDIKLNLAVSDIRIEAPIPGKAAVGIEVPNKTSSPVLLRDLLESKEFRDFSSPLTFAVGKNISGQVIVADIAKMPHLLIAGATGAGKSVCINTLIMSVLYKANPDEVKLIMVDPKVVELSVYNGIPHMMIPVVTDPKKAAGALNWAVGEMSERYKKFADMNVRDLKGYNEKIDAMSKEAHKSAGASGKETEEGSESGHDEDDLKRLPQIVIIVDELADLMMVSKNEVEDAICRLAQLARAAGIHLIIATQRPSVDVITGLIKANMPSRIAFAVSSGVDSRTIIDINGAEKLLGKGDMLFYPSGYPKPMRVQGAFVSDREVSDVVEFLSQQNKETVYNQDIEEKMKHAAAAEAGSEKGNSGYDEYFEQAGKFVIEKGKASTSMLQRMFKIGFNRAGRIIDQLEETGVVGAEEGTKPRKVLMSMEEFEQLTDSIV